ncbi:addiction module antidote protein, HigA family [Caulobacter sp. D4A]|uniref:HigA family addiction module antitoxin n=1 Tax=unclassified Caulobacter TaxID=2648921 RepID=UPI000D73C5DA|nr:MULTISPECIES: HigA family addiction module antitoxin [unclassified Caulobacter]PXA80763.1 addiction module antidote protein, HigA family [Caulobacter sp. D4A]PXA91674.1 addiction module antidote protein, HigA family [Caulobacter sp. D5]
MRRVAHPGVVLRRHLGLAGMNASALARKLNVPPNRVTSILNGKRAITGDTALRLAHFFQTDPEVWLRLQTEYDLYVASKQYSQEIKALPTIGAGEDASRGCTV